MKIFLRKLVIVFATIITFIYMFRKGHFILNQKGKLILGIFNVFRWLIVFWLMYKLITLKQ